jgi:hypothetical protein
MICRVKRFFDLKQCFAGTKPSATLSGFRIPALANDYSCRYRADSMLAPVPAPCQLLQQFFFKISCFESGNSSRVTTFSSASEI